MYKVFLKGLLGGGFNFVRDFKLLNIYKGIIYFVCYKSLKLSKQSMILPQKEYHFFK